MLSVLRVGFNAYLLATPGLRGWNRYSVNLLAALPAHGVRPVLYSRTPIHADYLARLPAGSFEVCVGPPIRYLLWENRWLPRQLETDRIDVFHCPMNYGLPWSTPCPRVLTLHDAIDEVYYRPRAGWWGRWKPSALRPRLANWAARRRAHHVITVSEHAKRDIVKHLGVSPKRMSVIYEAADPVFHQSVPPEAVGTIQAKRELSRPYFLYLGGWERRKNVPFLLRGFAASGLTDVELVLAGGKDSERSHLLELAGELGCAERVKLLGFVPDIELPALYGGALAFVYPSEYEGFGLQLVEAMEVGCPVLAARATCLPEILGSGGATFALDDPGELAALLRHVATDKLLRSTLAARAQARSLDFSWDKAAAETAEVYRKLVER
jgi:glycosyltransferase involved in cell wall biosynthesis